MPAFDYGDAIQLPIQAFRTVDASAVQGKYAAGQLGITGDGRWFRYARAGASTLVPGNVVCGPAPVTAHVGNTATATAAGATTVTFTQGATAVTLGQYQDGWLNISVTPGAGQIYGLREGVAVGSATANTYNLAAGEAIVTALTTTSRIDLIANPYRGVIQCPTTTIASNPVGVAVSAPTTGQWCWVQVKGPASVLTDGTVIVGNLVVVPSTNTGGACVAESATAAVTVVEVPIGEVMKVSATTAWSVVNLSLLR